MMLRLKTWSRSRDVSRPISCGFGLVGPGLGLSLVDLGLARSGLGVETETETKIEMQQWRRIYVIIDRVKETNILMRQ